VGRWYRDKIRFMSWELLPVLEDLLRDPVRGRLSLARETFRRWKGRPEIYDGLYRLLIVCRLTRYRSDRAAARCMDRLENARAAVRGMLGRDGVLLLPTLGTLAPRHGRMNRLSLKPGVNGLFTPLTLCNYLNLPAITVPAWRCRDAGTGMVPGVMLAAAPGSEELLLSVAERVESIVGPAPGEEVAI
jgi:Asp-tRNA(Asn)/Glu-tRNA(Gln) amidotransferase A subunit family amidase